MDRTGILSGLKVLDLSRVLAAPYCCMMLADLGADVLKVERPEFGDDSRGYAPFANGESGYFMNLNRNKRSITINLKSPEGKKLFLDLVKKCDVVVENYRPGTMEKLGLGYDDLKKVNPALIYGAISGFGHYGPYSSRPGYDIIAQAMSGLMSTTGWPDSEPTRTSTAIGDVLGGLNCAVGILAAYTNRLKTGKGEKVDIALVDSVVSGLEVLTQIYLISGRIPQRVGNRYESAYPYDSFRASDGSFVMSCGNDKLFAELCEEMGKMELLDDPRFCTNRERVQNPGPLKEIIEDWLGDMTCEEALALLNKIGIPASPILSIDQVVVDPHIAVAREMFVQVDHPVAGKQTITGSPFKFTSNKVQFEKAAPLLGEDTEQILAEYLNLSADEVSALRAANAI